MTQSHGPTAFEKIEQTVALLEERIGAGPDVVLILGSGLSPFADRISNAQAVPYSELPNWPGASVVGHRGVLVAGDLGGKRVVALAGRAHVYEGHSAQSVVLPVRVMARWGAKVLIVTNSAGGISPDLEAGDLMVIRDHLNLSGQNPLQGPNDDRLGPRFPDMTWAYEPALRKLAHEAAGKTGLNLKEGVYAGLLGPTYETPAEVQMLRNLGADAVGMSTVHEVIAACHIGVRVLGVSCISNLAAGVTDQPLSHDEVTETAGRVRSAFEGLLEQIVTDLTL